MKRILPALFLAALVIAPAAFAQENHGEVGAYGEFFRWNDANVNFAGVGGRVTGNLGIPWVQLEGELTYDFAQEFGQTFTSSGTSGGSFTVSNSSAHVLHGLFGPKFQTSGGPVRFFLTLKGGAIDFMFNNAPAGLGSFRTSVQNVRVNNVNAVFYPGVGGEAYFGPIGLRLDVGDEMYFNNGARHNLRITFGPTIRF